MGGSAAAEACWTVLEPEAGSTVAVRSVTHGSGRCPGRHSHSTPAASVRDADAPPPSAARTAASGAGVVVVEVVDDGPQAAVRTAAMPRTRARAVIRGDGRRGMTEA